uniref:Uncharacterized protein n=1 Tax=Anopheles atroparvus TaxID=41427 RepID=A0AAG5D3T8_ANOAO
MNVVKWATFFNTMSFRAVLVTFFTGVKIYYSFCVPSRGVNLSKFQNKAPILHVRFFVHCNLV